MLRGPSLVSYEALLCVGRSVVLREVDADQMAAVVVEVLEDMIGVC
jgi:hypothetical protein